jgi:hypothetical protein
MRLIVFLGVFYFFFSFLGVLANGGRVEIRRTDMEFSAMFKEPGLSIIRTEVQSYALDPFWGWERFRLVALGYLDGDMIFLFLGLLSGFMHGGALPLWGVNHRRGNKIVHAERKFLKRVVSYRQSIFRSNVICCGMSW